MNNQELEGLLPKLDEAAQFIKFGRKEIIRNIKTVLVDVDGKISTLGQNIVHLEDKKKELLGEKSKHEQEIKDLQEQIGELTKLNQGYVESINSGKEQLETLSSLKAKQDKMIAGLNEEIASLKQNEDDLNKQIIGCEQSINEISEAKIALEDTVSQLKADAEKKEDTISSLKQDFAHVSDRFDLVSTILAAKPCLNEGLIRFKNVLYGDFMDFANDESSLDEEAKVVMSLQSVEKEMGLIARFPGIFNKNIFAIGGGFSSGKSQFVNSFIKQDKIKLPVGMKPVTAIPTYVVADNHCNICCYSKSGGKVDILESFFVNLSHEYIKSFKFNLKKIMPFMTLSCQLPPEYFENICFIDTPGYNPAMTDEYTDEDKRTASEYLERANTLIWVIGLDSQGTIPASDLEFLSELNLNNKKLYVMANKADLRSEDELEDILDDIADSLYDYDMPYCGICAYSAKQCKEYIYRKESLLDFLQKENSPVGAKKKIVETVKTELDKYRKAITANIDNAKGIKSSLHSLDLDLLESGQEFDPETSEKIGERLSGLQNIYDVKKLKRQLSVLAELEESMVSVIDHFFSCMTTPS